MTMFNFSQLANASAPLFARYLTRYNTRNFWPLPPLALAAMLEQLELSARRNKLQICGVQPGCSVLLCDEAQQCQWFRLVNDCSGHDPDTEIALLSPLGMALIGKNVGDLVKLIFAGRRCSYIVTDIIRVRQQPASPKLSV